MDLGGLDDRTPRRRQPAEPRSLVQLPDRPPVPGAGYDGLETLQMRDYLSNIQGWRKRPHPVFVHCIPHPQPPERMTIHDHPHIEELLTVYPRHDPDDGILK